MIVAISRALLERLSAEAAASPGAEICGLLLGTVDRIETALPAANVAADPRRRFEIDPAVLFAVHRDARAGGAQPVGHYHSHPGGSAEPSTIDAESAVPGQLWLILGADGPALFLAVAQGSIAGRFERVELTSRAEGGLHRAGPAVT